VRPPFPGSNQKAIGEEIFGSEDEQRYAMKASEVKMRLQKRFTRWRTDHEEHEQHRRASRIEYKNYRDAEPVLVEAAREPTSGP
jgi:hypothetical protein